MMDTVTVSSEKLLETLKENRVAHIEEYEAAVTTYRKEAAKKLRAKANEVRDGKTLSMSILLPQPQSFAAEYDRAIAMVEWSIETDIELSEQDFRSFVLDEWNWRGQFAATTSFYNGR